MSFNSVAAWNRRHFLGAAAALPLAAQKKKDEDAPPPTKPNVVLVIADDLPAWVLGCYGNVEIKTPNIDRMARTGVRYSNSFVVTPVCSASRATLFSGRTPMQHGIHDYLTAQPIPDPPQGQKAAPASFAQEVLLTDLLSSAGYQCGYVGKWHMGNDQMPGHGIAWSYTLERGSSSYNDPVLCRNGQCRQEKGYLPELLTNNALEFLQGQKSGQPFFLTVSYTNPHTPYEGHPQKYYDLYANTRFETFGIEPAAANALGAKEYLKDTVGNLRKYAAAVTALDDQVGILYNKLRQGGLADNTILIFTGDNGYLLGQHGLWSKGHASNPINMYDESVRVPMLWNWPGRIPIESSRAEMISFADFVPTLCEAAAVTPPARNLPGRSYLWTALNRKLPTGQSWPMTVFGTYLYTDMARTARYKLVIRNGGQGPNELFDFSRDPRERVNQFDNPNYITTRDAMRRQLEEWKSRYSS